MRQSRETRQKLVVKEAVQKMKGFFSTEKVLKYAQEREANIGIATVYRFLKEQRQKKEIYCYQCDGKTVYSKEKRSHCHFIDEETGEITHFDIESLDFLKGKIPGTIESFQIEVRGRKK